MVVTTQPIRRSHYRMLGLVGHGQFGQVYCAIHRKTGEFVALKHLHKDRFPTHKFLRELRFLLSLEHPNIVTCHALEHSIHGRQLVLDYCEGGTLRSILESDTVLTITEALGLVLDILAGLDHAHQQGIIHCDIKPENILLQLTPQGWIARISDFGIARLSPEVNKSEMGHTGSPAYMAPERFYNQHPISSDLYAVGVILYELLLGKRPFSGTPMELMVAHLNHIPHLPEDLPIPLKEITRKALQKLALKRFQSAQAMRREILQVYQRYQSGDLPPHPIGGKVWPAVVNIPALPWVAILHAIEGMGMATFDRPAPQDSPLPAADRSQTPTSLTRTSLLITASQGQVWFYHWPETGAMVSPVPTQGFHLPDTVQQFVPIPQGAILATSSSLHLLSMSHGLGRIAQEGSPMHTAIASHGRWFATARPTQSSTVEVLIRHLKALPQGEIKISAACRVPITITGGEIVAFLPLDHHHMALVVQQPQQTVFHLVTRRGHYLGPLTLSIPLYNLVATGRPYRYLALEVNRPQSLLVLDLKPFRIVRYRADIAPAWIFETAVGYGLLDRDGHLSLMNEEGQIINRMAQLPCPTAMLQLSPSQFLWSVPEGSQSRLYRLDLAQLGLDLVF